MQRSSHSAPVPASAATTAGGAAAQSRLFDEMRARMLQLEVSPRTEEARVGSPKRVPRTMPQRTQKSFLRGARRPRCKSNFGASTCWL